MIETIDARCRFCLEREINASITSNGEPIVVGCVECMRALKAEVMRQWKARK